MADIRMFRTISGEDVVAEYVETNEFGDVYINAIQLIVVPSKKNADEQSYAFAPFPQFAKPKSDAKLTINSSLIGFYIDIDEEFLVQYNTIFGHIMTPTSKIILS